MNRSETNSNALWNTARTSREAMAKRTEVGGRATSVASRAGTATVPADGISRDSTATRGGSLDDVPHLWGADA